MNISSNEHLAYNLYDCIREYVYKISIKVMNAHVSVLKGGF